MEIRAKHNVWHLSTPQARFLAAFFFVGVTTVCAQVTIRVWPVPVTLQVAGVILSGLALGSRWGAISQIQYVVAGALGAPVFAGWTGGPAALAGPIGGYIFGFVLGAYVAGWIYERLQNRTKLASLIAGAGGIAGVYALGAPWLAIWLGRTGARPWNNCILGAWQMGIAPFIGIDLLKAAAASALADGGRWKRIHWIGLRNLGW